MKKRRHEEGTAGDAGAQKKMADSSGQGGPGKRPRLDRFALKVPLTQSVQWVPLFKSGDMMRAHHMQKHAFLFNKGEERRGFMVTCPVHRELHALAQVLRMLHHVRCVITDQRLGNFYAF